MIHHIPPRLTPAQARDCESLRVIDISARIGQYLTPTDREAARHEARYLLRESIGKDWSEGRARVTRAAAFGSALVDEIAATWPSVTVDARPVLVLLLINDRIVRYLRLYGGARTRAIHDKIERESRAAVAPQN